MAAESAMGAGRQALAAAVDAVYEQTLRDLKQLLAMPSVAAQSRHLAATAASVAGLFEQAGARVTTFADCGAPLIGVDFAGESDRTLLFYNHYDVQPEDPRHEWETDPFVAVERDGYLFARGASDNKGDLLCRLGAVRALQSVYGGRLPCRVKFLVEGEEEIGSPNLAAYLQRHGHLFAADACVWEFGLRDEANNVVLYGGLKGICYLELTVRTAAVDMHSSLAPLADNAAWQLVWALQSMRAPDGSVTIAGFYDGVPPLSAAARRQLAQLPFDAAAFRRTYGLARVVGHSHTDRMAAWLTQPTLTICGLESGYTGPGAKTIVPREARAKLDIRLVGAQDPEEMAAKVMAHLERHGFGNVDVKLLGPERPYQTDLQHPFVQLVAATAQTAYEAPVVVYPTAAGSGPMYTVGAALNHLPIVSTGVSHAGSHAHAPNENIRLADWRQGMLHMALLIDRFARSAW